MERDGEVLEREQSHAANCSALHVPGQISADLQNAHQETADQLVVRNHKIESAERTADVT